MLKWIVTSFEQEQRDAAAREAQLLLRSARALTWGVRRLLRVRCRWAAWAMCHAAEALGRTAWRIWKRDLARRR
jgi:hypothetical protein